ncbi:MAG: hypothetical protein H7321_01705 [Bacteroidia bacterium]|nr:hypothetical protein [Bacteroidia bacterium]
MAEIHEDEIAEPIVEIKEPILIKEPLSEVIVETDTALEFTIENLEALLIGYVGKKNNNNLSGLYSTMLKAIEGDTIKITVGAQVQFDMLDKDRPELQSFLRKRFDNETIFLSVIVDETVDTTSKTPYTPQEKLKAMKELRPDLNYLIEKFNLKIK